MLNIDAAKKKNEELAEELHKTMTQNAEGIKELRNKLSNSYWFIVILSVCVFLVGIVLLCVPLLSALGGKASELEAIIAGGFGIADLFALALYGPIERIQKLMGDMSQLILSVNCNQVQVGLSLIEMDVVNDRKSVGKAAENICNATEKHIKLIEKYFETAVKHPVSKNNGTDSTSVTLNTETIQK